MNSARRLVACSIALLALTAGCLAPSTPPAPPAADIATADPKESPVAGIRPEGRLRKLHLVRPDLIPYPIAYEVYC